MIKTVMLVFISVSIILAIACIAFEVFMAKKNGAAVQGKKKKIGAAVTSIMLIAAISANAAAYRFNTVITQYMEVKNIDSDEAEAATADAMAVSEEVENEGIVLLKNEENALPLTSNKVNVFGYVQAELNGGGEGSGSGGDEDSITLAEGLANAGLEINEELSQFYEDNLVERQDESVFSMTGGDHSVYEPTADTYSDELIENAKEFSDTAIYVLGRTSGEGGDLPTDMADWTGGTAGRHYLELQDVTVSETY